MSGSASALRVTAHFALWRASSCIILHRYRAHDEAATIAAALPCTHCTPECADDSGIHSMHPWPSPFAGLKGLVGSTFKTTHWCFLSSSVFQSRTPMHSNNSRSPAPEERPSERA